MPKYTLEQIQERLKDEGEFRRIGAAVVEREEVNQEEMIIPMSVSSEHPVERWFGYEVLDHKRAAIVLDYFKDGGGALKDTHYGDQVGNVLNPKIDTEQRKLRVDCRFSKNNERAVLLYKDYLDGYRKNVSIRYIIHEMVLEKEEDGVGYYRVTKWEPVHVSLEPDPADPTVGAGRDSNNQPEIIPLDLSGNVEEQIEKFNRANGNKLKILINQKRSEKPMAEVTETVDVNKAVQDALNAEAARTAGIDKLAEDLQRNVPGIDLKKEALTFKNDRSKSVADFQTFVIGKMSDPVAIRKPDTHVGLSDKDIRDYSIRKVFLYQLGKLDEKEVGMELEASRALSQKIGKQPKEARSIFLPDEIMNRRREVNLRNLTSAERDLIVGTPASGGYLVKDQYIPQSFIELLQNAMVLKSLGCPVITGLVGNIPMNRELDNYTTYWVAEGAGPTKSNITFGQEVCSPKKGGALAKYSYEFLMQTSIAVEIYIETRLASACALQADKAGIYGTGANSQPKGLKLWTGIGGVLGAGFVRSKALAMEGQIETGNATTLGTMKWASRGSVRSTLKDKPISANTPGFLCGGVNDDNKMIGYDYNNVSNQFEAGDLFLGIWQQLLVLYWNEIELMANPYDTTVFPAGDVLVRALQALDTFVVNPAAFSLATGVN